MHKSPMGPLDQIKMASEMLLSDNFCHQQMNLAIGSQQLWFLRCLSSRTRLTELTIVIMLE